jgi:hypothetical protein
LVSPAETYERHVGAVALEIVKRHDLEVNAGTYVAKGRRDRENTRVHRSRRILGVGSDRVAVTVQDWGGTLTVEELTGEVCEALETLGLAKLEEADVDALWEYVRPHAVAAVAAVLDGGQQAARWLPGLPAQSLRSERDRLARRASRRDRRPANELVGDDAMKEAMAIIAFEESRAPDRVLTDDWTAERGDDGWEDVVEPLERWGWLRIAAVPDLPAGERGDLPLDGYVFAWNRARMPSDAWRATREVKRLAAKPYRDRGWLLQRASVPDGVIADECGASRATIAAWRRRHEIPALPAGRRAAEPSA